MGEKHTTHLNDKTMKYKSMIQTQRQHQYLGLPGKLKLRYPQEVVFPNPLFARTSIFAICLI